MSKLVDEVILKIPAVKRILKRILLEVLKVVAKEFLKNNNESKSI